MTVKKPSLRKAVNDHCKGCIYDPLSGLGTWRQQVEKCTVITCPLYPVRPISKPSSGQTQGDMPEGLRKYHEEKKAAKNTGEKG